MTNNKREGKSCRIWSLNLNPPKAKPEVFNEQSYNADMSENSKSIFSIAIKKVVTMESSSTNLFSVSEINQVYRLSKYTLYTLIKSDPIHTPKENDFGFSPFQRSLAVENTLILFRKN